MAEKSIDKLYDRTVSEFGKERRAMSALAAERVTLADLESAKRRLLVDLCSVEGEIAAIEAVRTARARAKAIASAAARTIVFRDGTPRDTSGHREIARRYAWYTQRTYCPEPRPLQGQTGRSRLVALIRLRELEHLISVRYGPILPDDDAGRDDLTIVAHHIAHLGPNAERHIIGWAALWAPWMAKEEAAGLAARVVNDPLKWTADTLACRLRLTADERNRLAITTIGAIDQNKDQRARLRRLKSVAANRMRRRKEGAVPRIEYEANSLANTRPWEALGMSRARWYRLGKPSAVMGGSSDGDPPDPPISAVTVKSELTNTARETSANTAGESSIADYGPVSCATRCGPDYGAHMRASTGLRARHADEGGVGDALKRAMIVHG